MHLLSSDHIPTFRFLAKRSLVARTYHHDQNSTLITRASRHLSRSINRRWPQWTLAWPVISGLSRSELLSNCVVTRIVLLALPRRVREAAPDEDEEDEEDQEEEFYTRGGEELLEARIDIAEYSLPRAKRRVAFQKQEATIPVRTHVKFRKQIKEKLQGFELQGSQTAGERHVSMTRISPDGKSVAVGSK